MIDKKLLCGNKVQMIHESLVVVIPVFKKPDPVKTYMFNMYR